VVYGGFSNFLDRFRVIDRKSCRRSFTVLCDKSTHEPKWTTTERSASPLHSDLKEGYKLAGHLAALCQEKREYIIRLG
jgi:hypothetical protein